MSFVERMRAKAYAIVVALPLLGALLVTETGHSILHWAGIPCPI